MKKTKHELAIFVVVGLATVLIDFLVYRGLPGLNIMQIDVAKGIGCLTGMSLAYFANRIFTFGHKDHGTRSVQRFSLLYATTLGVNVWINRLALAMLGKVSLAFLLATRTSACLNFLGLKWFVFKTKSVTAFS